MSWMPFQDQFKERWIDLHGERKEKVHIQDYEKISLRSQRCILLVRDLFLAGSIAAAGLVATWYIGFISTDEAHLADPWLYKERLELLGLKVPQTSPYRGETKKALVKLMINNDYSERHKQYNLRVVDLLTKFFILRIMFSFLKSNMGIRFKSGKALNLMYHYLLVLVRVGGVAYFLATSGRDAYWILDQTMHTMFIENKWQHRKDMDKYKRPISSFVDSSANATQECICYLLWAIVFGSVIFFTFAFIMTLIYCCAFGLCLQGNSFSLGINLLKTFFIETAIGTKSWRKFDGEDDGGDDDQKDGDDGYYSFKRTRNLRPKEIQAIEDQMKEAEAENDCRR